MPIDFDVAHVIRSTAAYQLANARGGECISVWERAQRHREQLTFDRPDIRSEQRRLSRCQFCKAGLAVEWNGDMLVDAGAGEALIL